MDITICDFQFKFIITTSCKRSERYFKFTMEKWKNKKESINHSFNTRSYLA